MKTSRWMVLAAAALCSAVEARDEVTTLAAAAGAPEKRSALVVGNSNYAQGALKNPLNDARAVARELAASGFEVLLLEDGTQAGMRRAIRRFGDRIEQGGVGLFYYAGHGIQMKGRNFLVPVNADIDREYEVEYNSVDVSMVLAMMDAAKNPLNIVILDACRNNPFARSLRVAAAGLAPLDAPAGTFIAFATAPGAIANDGIGDNGVYTKHLLAHLGKPGMPIEQLFKQVRISVMDETRGEQTPWESSSLRGDFAFRPGVPAGAEAAQLAADALRREREAYLRETETLIQAALERQRREFEAEASRSDAGRAPASASGAVAPVTVAPAVDRSPLPQVGDRWTYRLSQRHIGSKEYTVTVSAVSARAIVDQVSINGGLAKAWPHAPGSYLAAPEGSFFSPYMAQFEERLWSGRRLSRIEQLDESVCKGMYFCTAKGRVAGRETITLPAGRFETIKVVIEQSWQPSAISNAASSQFAELWGSRTITVWYSPEVKRAVKVSSRLAHGNAAPLDTHFDLELVGYQLGQPSMTTVAIRGETR